MIASAPGKLILTGEYAVLDGAPAIVVAVDRRAIARRGTPQDSSPFLVAVADEVRARRGPAANADVVVDSTAFYDGAQKLGLGSSAAVTVAATALGLGAPLDLDETLAAALAAHATAQGAKGARGSGADIAAAVHGGTLVFTLTGIAKTRWPDSVRLVPFFTGASADTASLVARVTEARAARRTEVDAALTAIGDASRATAAALRAPPDLVVRATLAGFQLAAEATDALARATRVPLVPACLLAARRALAPLGAIVKTTGAGGGDIGVAVLPAATDVTAVAAGLIEAGCQPLRLNVDDRGVDLRTDAQ